MSRGAIKTVFDHTKRVSLTRAVLESPAEQSHKHVALAVGITAEAVRQIGYGILYADLCPGLERLERSTTDRVGAGRTCTQCIHWVNKTRWITTAESRYITSTSGLATRRLGSCGLGIPEADNLRFARGCGAFTDAPTPVCS